MTDPVIAALELSDDFLARFRIERILGEGGMGFVALATQLDLNRLVAVKFLKDDYAAHDPTALRRFVDEGKICASLRHPNLVQLYLSGRDSVLYLVYEFVDGQPLDAILRGRSKHRLPVDEAVRLARQICDGMAHAHERHVIHRDLKPANILVSAAGSVAKVTDFGIARDPLTGPRTRSGVVIGTPTYMAPEQAKGVRDIDARVDVYALSAMVYEMLAGRPPYVGAGLDVLRMHVDPAELPPPLARLQPLVPGRLAAVIHRGLEKDREARFADAGELGRALAEVDFRMRAGVPDPSAEGTVRFDSAVVGSGGGAPPATGPATVAVSEPKAAGRGRGQRALSRAVPSSPSRSTGAASRVESTLAAPQRGPLAAVVVTLVLAVLVVAWGLRARPVVGEIRLSGTGVVASDRLVLKLSSSEELSLVLGDQATAGRLGGTDMGTVHDLDAPLPSGALAGSRPQLRVARRKGTPLAIDLPTLVMDLSSVRAGDGRGCRTVCRPGTGGGAEAPVAGRDEAVALVQEVTLEDLRVRIDWRLEPSAALLLPPAGFPPVPLAPGAPAAALERLDADLRRAGALELLAELEARARPEAPVRLGKDDQGAHAPTPGGADGRWDAGKACLARLRNEPLEAAALGCALALDVVAGRMGQAERLAAKFDAVRAMAAAMTIRSFRDHTLRRDGAKLRCVGDPFWVPPPEPALGCPSGFWIPPTGMGAALSPLVVLTTSESPPEVQGRELGRRRPSADWKDGLLRVRNIEAGYAGDQTPFYMGNAMALLGDTAVFRDLRNRALEVQVPELRVPLGDAGGGRVRVWLQVYEQDVGVLLRLRLGERRILLDVDHCADYHELVLGSSGVADSSTFSQRDFSPEHLGSRPIYHVVEFPAAWVRGLQFLLVDAVAAGIQDRIGTNARERIDLGEPIVLRVPLDVPLVRDVVVSVPTGS